MNRISLHEQNHLLQHRERIEATLQQYPNVINVGVGLKETGHALTNTLCYRVYVREKKPGTALQQQEIVPSTIEGFTTDIIPYGVVDTCSYDDTPTRPLKGGIQIKQDIYDGGNRGIGTLGCLAVLNDGSGKIVGLTNEHVLRTHSLEGADGNQVGQPYKVDCCCCCTKNIIGKVIDSSEKPDCAIIELHADIISEIQAGNTLHEIMEIGAIKGKARVKAGDPVKKRGAGSLLTHGIVKDVHFDGDNLLIAPIAGEDEFATYGDSGSIVLTEDDRVVGLLWGTKRDRFARDNFSEPAQPSIDRLAEIPDRTHGVAAPIEKVEQEMNIIVFEQHTVPATVTIHADDTLTFAVPSILPPEQNPKKHFVTVKGTGDVILTVAFNEPVAAGRIHWESNGMPVTLSDNNTTGRISRDTGDEGMKNEILITVDGFEVARVFVWVVWSRVKSFFANGNPALPDPGLNIVMESTATRATRYYYVDFIIEPLEIVDINADIPDLRGPNTIPPPSVPAAETNVFNAGVDLSGGAKTKWDVSVRLKRNFISPQTVIFFDPEVPRKYLSYPSDPIAGNYSATTTFVSDPYDTTVPPETGRIGLSVEIEHLTPYNAVAPSGQDIVNRVIEFRLFHESFARLELGGRWFVISNGRPGRIFLRYKKKSEFFSNIDYNQDGDKADNPWVPRNEVVEGIHIFSFYDDNALGFED